MTFVKLAGPAKIGGKRYQAGETVEVGDDAVAGLEDMGLIAEYPTELTAAPGVDLRQVDLAGLPTGEKLITITEEQFQQAIAAEAEALAGAVNDQVIRRTAGLQAERDAAFEDVANLTRRVEELEAELAAERVFEGEIRAQLEASIKAHAEAKETPEQTDTPPSEPAENTASKKGAAAKAKG